MNTNKLNTEVIGMNDLRLAFLSQLGVRVHRLIDAACELYSNGHITLAEWGKMRHQIYTAQENILR